MVVLTSDHDFKTSSKLKATVNRKGNIVQYSTLPLKNEYPIDGIELSLVVPAYNEESRLPTMLEQTVKYFTNKTKFEIIIVNDGSKDKTWKTIENLIAKKYPNVDIIGVNFDQNGGKGHAVVNGFKYARGDYILMLDADGATDIKDYDKLRKELDGIKDRGNEGITIGSRYLIAEEAKAEVK